MMQQRLAVIKHFTDSIHQGLVNALEPTTQVVNMPCKAHKEC